MIGFILSKVGLLLILVVAGFAWWKGATAEREGALAVVIAWLITLALQALLPHNHQLRVIAAVDGLLALALLVVAFRHSSLWLGMAMVLQGGVLAVHSLALGEAISARQYYIALNLASSAMLWAIVFATIGSWMNRSRQAKASTPPPSGLAAA